jgi:hypothetical protein
MYFQSLIGDDTRLLQGAVRLSCIDPVTVAPVFSQIVGGWRALGGASAALRLDVSAAGEATATFFLTAPEPQSAGLRRLFARLALLDGVAGTKVEFPTDAAEFEHFRDAWPGSTVALVGDLRTPNGTQLLCRGVWPGLVAPVAARMISLGAELAVHTNITSASPSADMQKGWARSLIELDGQAAPAALRQHQQGEFAAARDAAFNIETLWGASPEFAPALAASLDNAAHLQQPALRQVSLHAVVADLPDAVSEAIHTLVLEGENPFASSAAAGYGSETEAVQALTIPALPKMPSKSGPDGDDGRAGVRWQDMPRLPNKDRFCFVSYAHADATPVYGILRQLDQRNISYWYDRGIPAGEEWDDELEAKLAACTAVVAFLSPRSVRSRYCRREIKYADILGKPILPVMLEATRLEGGLSFILSHIQHTDATDPQLLDRLASSIGGLT